MAVSVIRECPELTFDRPSSLLIGEVGIGMSVSFDAGQTVIIEGDPIEHVYRIISGSVRLYKAVVDGRRQIIDFLGPEDYFGLTGFDRHAYSVETINDVVMIRYPKRQLETAIEKEAGLGQQLFRLACAELDRAQNSMLLLGRKSADERLASFLLDLAARQADAERDDKSILHLAMSRQDIADHLGLTIETVSRIFTRFRQAGLISLPDRHAVIIKSAEQLAHIAEGGLDA